MKLGLIVECAPGGLEELVCPKILALLAAETRTTIEVDVVTMINKKLLIHGAAERAAALFTDGCDRVIILWDENPPWTPEKDFADQRCWHTEREQLITNLGAAQIDLHKVGLVCIEREFETWILHDAPLLCNVISQGPHQAKVKPIKNPPGIEAPKRHLMRLFRNHKASYNAPVVARRCNQHLTDLERLKDCDTFRYFVQQALGGMPKGWKPYVYRSKGPNT